MTFTLDNLWPFFYDTFDLFSPFLGLLSCEKYFFLQIYTFLQKFPPKRSKFCLFAPEMLTCVKFELILTKYFQTSLWSLLHSHRHVILIYFYLSEWLHAWPTTDGIHDVYLFVYLSHYLEKRKDSWLVSASLMTFLIAMVPQFLQLRRRHQMTSFSSVDDVWLAKTWSHCSDKWHEWTVSDVSFCSLSSISLKGTWAKTLLFMICTTGESS